MNKETRKEMAAALKTDLDHYQTAYDHADWLAAEWKRVYMGGEAKKLLAKLQAARLAGLSKRAVVLEAMGMKSQNTQQYDNLVRKLEKLVNASDQVFERLQNEIKGEN